MQFLKMLETYFSNPRSHPGWWRFGKLIYYVKQCFWPCW